MKMPFMTVAIGDFLAEVQALSTEAVGAYTFILIQMWNNGGELPNDDNVLARCTRLSIRRWAIVKPSIWRLFIETGEPPGSRITHERLRKEYALAVHRSMKARENGARGGKTTALKTLTRYEAKAHHLLQRGRQPTSSRAAPLIQEEEKKEGSSEKAQTESEEPPSEAEGAHLVRLLDDRRARRPRR
jgi:uncharacterized protein YdaU (DUF1376 family)